MEIKPTDKVKSKRFCVSCCDNITKLKKLCKQKGLTTSFSKKVKPCKKHKKDNIMLIYNIYKCNQPSAAFQKSISNSISNALKVFAREKVLKKKAMTKKLMHLDEFKVEDVGEVPNKSLVLSNLPREVSPDEGVVEDDKSESTVICFIKPQDPVNIKAKKISFKPNEQDSLGLLNTSEDFLASQNLNKVKLWTQFGHPFVNDLPESQYEIPGYGQNKNDTLGWVSPALSPIYS